MLCRDKLRGRHSTRVAWIVYLACFRSHVLRAYYNFESKQVISITLFGRRPNNNNYMWGRYNDIYARSLQKNCCIENNYSNRTELR